MLDLPRNQASYGRIDVDSGALFDGIIDGCSMPAARCNLHRLNHRKIEWARRAHACIYSANFFEGAAKGLAQR
ncbi:MAG TPA: hypothetical protein VEB21_13540 [Terriglobales bacterium]|nr:hypothetical protein [Terriglobales bacterium]